MRLRVFGSIARDIFLPGKQKRPGKPGRLQFQSGTIVGSPIKRALIKSLWD
jgi:hypothetical protein